MNPQTFAEIRNTKQFDNRRPNRQQVMPEKNKSVTAKASATKAQVSNAPKPPAIEPKNSGGRAKSNVESAVLESARGSASGLANNETAFRLDAPSAHTVLLAAEFTEWEKSPIKMIKGGGGVWHVKVPLSSGRYPYRFIVDGEWQDDPNCRTQVPNSFGTFNSVVEIP